jgi:potassium-dependent mechanosensitive channel
MIVKAGVRLPVFLLVLVVFLAGALLCPSPSHSQTAHQEILAPQKSAAPQKTTAPASSAAIPVAEIATRATEVSNLLRILNARLAPSSQIETIRKQLPEVSERIDRKLTEGIDILEEQPTLEMLQAEEQMWKGIEAQTAGWLKVLTERAVALRDALDRLSGMKEIWIKTRDAAQASKAPGPVLQQVDEVLAAIDAAESPLEAQRSSVLDLQSKVSQEVGRCSAALAQITEAQHRAVGGIFMRDSLPIWSPELFTRAKARVPGNAREVALACQKDISWYFHDTSRGLLFHLGLFLLLLALFCVMRSRLHRWETGAEGASSSVAALDRPYAAALFGTLLITSGPLSEASPTIKAISMILAVAPMIRLARPLIDPRLISSLFILWALLAMDAIRQAFAGTPLIGQAILVFEALMGIAVLGWALLFGHLRRDAARASVSDRTGAFRVTAGLALFVLACALIAGASGYLRLSRILTSEIIAGGIVALALYAALRVVGGIVAFALRVWPLRLLHMVQHHRDLLERRVHNLMIWIAVLTWAARSLDYVGLLQPALSLGSAILAMNLERGSISISVADIIAFFLTVWIAYLLSAIIRFILKEDVYPRIGIQRGASYAASSLINYVILALGFVVALGVIGVSLTKMTVLAGAFGVGIGFGLQSVVNNFVSGLILLFERPIHVGDTVEVGDLLGEVRRIGIRASVVRTWHGSDIIVPNADLISKQVTNWTLSDRLRRIDLPVGVNYSADPKEVISVLESVARKHPDILKDPPPQALFTGYGDSSINFELRAWTDKFDEWPRIRSDLAVALYDAAHAAGMSFPFPQREVRVLHDPGAKPTAPPAEAPSPLSEGVPETAASKDEKKG